jgi:hypothetical protein
LVGVLLLSLVMLLVRISAEVVTRHLPVSVGITAGVDDDG